MVSRKPHPAELRERAVNMVFELCAETGNARGSIARVGHRLGINTETLRNWVNKAEVDSGQRPGITTEDKSGSRSWNVKFVSCGGRMRS
jgi:transposase